MQEIVYSLKRKSKAAWECKQQRVFLYSICF